RGDISTDIAKAAPRLKHSRLNAPVPAKSSSTRAPTTRAPRLLNTACLTRSGVGRTPRPLGTFKIRPPAWPPEIRIFLKFQTPTSKLQRNFKLQILNSRANGIGTLEVDASLDVGAWGLELIEKFLQRIPSSLPTNVCPPLHCIARQE